MAARSMSSNSVAEFLDRRQQSTSEFLLLIARGVGIASTLVGAHLRLWRSETLAAASATSLIAWLLTLLAMGVACEEVHTSGYRSKSLVCSIALNMTFFIILTSGNFTI